MNGLNRIGPRLAIAFALIAMVSVGVSGIIVFRTTESDLRVHLREGALTRLTAAADVFSGSGRLVAGARVDDPRMPKVVRETAVEGRPVSYYDGHLMWAAQRFPDRGSNGVLSVFQSDDRDRAFLDRMVRMTMVAGLIAIAVATLVGALIAHRTSRRLDRITRVAGAAAGGHLDDRVRDRGKDRVGDLARAVDTMTENLGGLLDRERRFAADVAHELRTPVAALVSATELLDDPRGRTIAREQVLRLRRLVDDLIETFRAQQALDPDDVDAIDLGPAVKGALAGTEPGAEVTVERSAWVAGESRRIARVLDNLVTNAHRYGAGPVEVTVDGPVVTVRDHGDGFPDWLVSQGPQRFRTESTSRGDGIGLGLSIVRSLSESMGATVAFSNHPEGGAQAVVRFALADEPSQA